MAAARHVTARAVAAAITCLLSVLLLWPIPAAAKAQRVVSLNMCTDALALRLADPGQLVSVTHWSLRGDAADDVRARPALRINRGHAEDVIALRPDLVLAGRFSARGAVALLRDLGYRVEMFDVPADVAAVRRQVRRMAAVLDVGPRADALLAGFDETLAGGRTAGTGRQPAAVVYTPNGGSAGHGTIVDEVLRLAGYRNVAADLGMEGWSRLPLESLLQAAPDLIVVSQLGGHAPSRAREVLRHPALTRLVTQRRLTTLSPDIWSCPGLDLAAAVAHLRELRP